MFSAPFIKIRRDFDSSDYAFFPAPIFRRRFFLEEVGKAELLFCAIGYGYCFVNGEAISKDLFLSPVSEYDKMVWYNRYDISHLLKQGENIIAVILGNGFFNENFPSSWNTSELPWRDHPKFALSVVVDGKTVLETDEQFLYSEDSFVTYNQLRSGETFDARLYDEKWKATAFDDSGYLPAVIDPDMGCIHRELCVCEPIREFEEYDFISSKKTDEGYLLDFGVNHSGYLRVCVDEAPGTVIEMRHAEEANDDGSLRINRLDIFYKTVDFQTDRYICGQKKYVWSPKFTYHGFRFVLVKGLSKPPRKGEFKSVFVHQDIKRTSDFSCSDELINWIYKAGIRSVYSNMHYALTDCPTREKLGWINDAQSSLDQIYMNFSVSGFMQKWGKDLWVSMQENGELPGVVPAFFPAKGFGPVADGLLFELPFVDYLHTGSAEKLIQFLPYMERYYSFFSGSDVDRKSWLGDWDGHINRLTDKEFVFLFYRIKFCRILLLAKEKAKIREGTENIRNDLAGAINQIKREYIDDAGHSVIDSQTAISMLICLNLFDNAPLLEQLKKRITGDNDHLTSGMLGLQYIYKALFENGAAEYAYRLITYKGSHSFSYWFNHDSTTLWESWEEGHTDSRNHHMLSGVLAWFFRGFLGISVDEQHPGYQRIELKPAFVSGLSFCKGCMETPCGEIAALWERKNGYTEYTVTISSGMNVFFRGEKLKPGKNIFEVKDYETLCSKEYDK